jgi:hypothetical protein
MIFRSKVNQTQKNTVYNFVKDFKIGKLFSSWIVDDKGIQLKFLLSRTIGTNSLCLGWKRR